MKSALKSMKYMLLIVHQAVPGRILFAVLQNMLEKIFYAFFFVYLIQYIITWIEKGSSFINITQFLTIIVIAQAGVYVLTTIYKYFVLRTDMLIYQHIYRKIMDKSIEMPLYFFEVPQYFDKFHRALDEAKDNAVNIVSYLSECCGQLARLVAIIAIIIKMDAFVLIFPIIPVLSSLFFGYYIMKLNYERKKDITTNLRRAEYYQKVFYDKKYSLELRLFHIKDLLFKKHKQEYINIIRTMWNYNKKIVIFEIMDKLIMRIFMLILATSYITYQILVVGRLSVGIYASLITAVSNVAWAVDYLLTHANKLISEGNLSKNLQTFLEELESVESWGDNAVPSFKLLTMKNVCFQYEGSNKQNVSNINLTIEKGQKIAFVGCNGAGKTTLIKLLLGLYNVQDGLIEYNGKNIVKYNKEEYVKKFAVVFQDFQIYASSILSNILMKQKLTESDMDNAEEALKMSGLKNKVSEFENGMLESLTREFDDEGKVMSLGDTQKIAIARTFANKNADVIIMDEPSSALDPIAEYELFERIIKNTMDKTVIFISHRLSSAKIADKIFLLENGTIIEEGTHEDLMLKDGKYAKMYKLQEQKYKLEPN